MNHNSPLDYHNNIYDIMISLNNNHISTINKKYNNNILLQHNLPKEILTLIFSHLPLSSLICCALSCNIFYLCVEQIIKQGYICITKYEEFKKIFYEKPKNDFMKLVCENINVLKYDNRTQYITKYEKFIFTNELPKLQKIILYANFVDQIQILKSFNCKKYDIVIVTCIDTYINTLECHVCLVDEIYYEMKLVCNKFKLYHKDNFYRIN